MGEHVGSPLQSQSQGDSRLRGNDGIGRANPAPTTAKNCQMLNFQQHIARFEGIFAKTYCSVLQYIQCRNVKAF